jgi:hypothetical protein
METSEFGKGLCYNLGLFLAHAYKLHTTIEQYREMRKTKAVENAQPPINTLFSDDSAASMWFNGAGDHLFELQVKAAPMHLRKRLGAFQDKVLQLRIPIKDKDATLKAAEWAIEEAKELLLLIDKAHKVHTCKAQWS